MTRNNAHKYFTPIGQSVASRAKSGRREPSRPPGLIDRYGAGTPAQLCAAADSDVPADQAPGSRRWMQLFVDA